MLSIWAAFIAWGSFFNRGGGENGLKNSLLAAIWGSICATIALVLANSGALAGLGGLRVQRTHHAGERETLAGVG